MREPDVINFIPNNVIKIEKLPNGSKNKVIYPNSEKYVGLNNILLKLNPSQYGKENEDNLHHKGILH